jgi:hypothetical protein
MTMYLPNPELRPTGSEIAEFIDVPRMTETTSGADRPVERRKARTVRLDTQTRLNITRWAEQYITGLVENHQGGPEDVRSIIHELHDQSADAYRDGRPVT